MNNLKMVDDMLDGNVIRQCNDFRGKGYTPTYFESIESSKNKMKFKTSWSSDMDVIDRADYSDYLDFSEDNVE